MFGIEDVGRDLRPVHPAALRLARIVQHAGGQFQFGFRQRIRRCRRGEIRHRIVGRVQAFGGGILQPGDRRPWRGGQRAGLGPQRRVFARGVEFLDRGAFGLAVEIAHDLAPNISRSLSATGWSAGGTLLAALTGSLAGSATGAWRLPSRRRRRFGRGRGCGRRPALSARPACRLALAFGRLRRVGHRRGGVQLEIADGRAAGRWPVRDAGSPRRSRVRRRCARRIGLASAEVADTVRKVAATAIRTRSNPARFFEQSRISHPLGRNCPGMEQSLISFVTACAGSAGLIGSSVATPARNDSYADDTCAPSCSQRHAGQLTTN